MRRRARGQERPLSRRDVRLVRVVVLAAVIGSLVDLVVVGHWLADVVVSLVAIVAVVQLGPLRRDQVLGRRGRRD